MRLAPRELLLTAIVMAGGVAGTIPLAQAQGAACSTRADVEQPMRQWLAHGRLAHPDLVSLD
jgi:hypothetical protein